MTSSRRIRIASWIVLGLYLILLAFLSLLPSGKSSWAGGWDTSMSPSLQNLLHIPAYTVLMVFALWTSYVSCRLGTSTIVITAFAAISYGVLMEWLQAVAIPGRTGCISDALLNALGVAIALIGLLPFRKIARQGPNPAESFSSAGSAPLRGTTSS